MESSAEPICGNVRYDGCRHLNLVRLEKGGIDRTPQAATPSQDLSHATQDYGHYKKPVTAQDALHSMSDCGGDSVHQIQRAKNKNAYQ